MCLVSACSYADPSFDTVLFRCDPEHGCPTGETCLGGTCQHAAATHDGVKCGTATCSPGQQCCITVINAPACIAGTAACPGLGAYCDGVEDCDSGSQCCQGDAVVCDPAGCLSAVCVTSADCSVAAPNCCPSPGASGLNNCSVATCATATP